ncbi:transporter [Sphingomonas sp. LB-2]|uniref:transporter n=1 Tax=Sphingomonas caeni TaxID=2984949 RepID=UPI00222F2F7D|nr:transporter [Sphingomonas caeni]MCW3849190.1 transporter [Sphingomonas caeni]
MRLLLLALVSTVTATAAQAQELRPLCADRPGLGTPSCTVDPGHVVAELGLADWTHDADGIERSDDWIAGDLLVRIGVTPRLEVQAGWTGYGATRSRPVSGGAASRESGTGDITLALRRNLSNPDGSGFSAALMPFATLPAGGHAIGAGDWGAGLVAPLSYSIGRFSVALTPEIDAAVDADRRGRHLAFGSVAGFGIALGGTVNSAFEIQAMRDEDPGGHATQILASASLAWQPRGDLQLDAGAVAGLNAASPDVELYIGISRRF